MSSLLLSPLFQASDKNGKPLDGAKLYIYTAETTTLTDAFLTIALEDSAKHTNPIVADASGHFQNIYVPSGNLYKTVLTDKNDAEILTRDNIPPYISSAGGTLPINGGGTGSDTAAGARTSLGAASAADVTALTSTVSTATTAQDQATWDAGISTVETVISPAKNKAAIKAIEAPQSGVPDAVLYEQRTLGAGGGTLTANTDNIRAFNQKYDPNGTVVLNASNGHFTPDEDGWIEVSAPAYAMAKNKVILFSVTDNAEVSTFIEQNSEIVQSIAAQGLATGFGPVTGGVEYRIHHLTSFSRNDEGQGRATNLGSNEKYAALKYWQNNGV